VRARQMADRKSLGTVDEIRFEGLERTNSEVLRALVQSKPGEPLVEEKVGADLRRIYGRGDFESVDYRIMGDSGPRAMVITPREKSWGPDYLRFGLGLESDFQGENTFNLLVQYRRTWLNRLGGEWLTEAQVGQQSYLYSEFFQPVDEAGSWFVAPHGRVGQVKRPVYSGENKVADYLVASASAGVDAGALLGTRGVVRVGALWNKVYARVETGDAILPSIRELSAGARAQLTIDQLDHAWFPLDGHSARVVAYGATKSFGSDLNYQRLEASGSWVRSRGPHTLNLLAAAGTDFGSGMPAYESFVLGGPLRLSGFRLDQFAGRRFAFGRAMYYNRVFPLPSLLGTGVYAGASAEIGSIKDRFDGLPSPGTQYSGSVFLGADTFAGPAYLGVGIGNGGSFSAYLLLGAP